MTQLLTLLWILTAGLTHARETAGSVGEKPAESDPNDGGRPLTVQAAPAEVPKALPKATREGAPPANYDESKVRSYILPDPLIMADGQPVRTAKDWVERRRPEIMEWLVAHQFGITPERKIVPTIEVVESGVPALSGKSRRTQARLRFGEDGPLIHVLVNLPANAAGKVPVIVHLGFSPNVLTVVDDGIDEGIGWDAARKSRVPGREGRKVGDFDPRPYLDAGIGVVNVYNGDIDPDFHGGTRSGVRSLFGTTDERKPDEWGAMGGWAWGLSRVLDFLETTPAVDASRVALSGVSRLGKAVLWAGAQDQRFAILLPVVSGEGGAALSRRNFGETIADLMNPNRYDYWFAPRYDDYSFETDKLPVDGHFLIAMAAPRPILLVTGSLDGWSDPRGEWLAAQAAEPVFKLFGKSGPGDGPMPAAETPVLSDLGWFMHDGPHGIFPSDHAAMIAFMKKHFMIP